MEPDFRDLIVMESAGYLLIAAFAGYLLGSLPFGYLVAKAKGVNIFEVGSKNPGATNVRRVLGKGPGNLVFMLDALKGAIAAGVPMLLRAFQLEKAKTLFANNDIDAGFAAGALAQLYGVAAIVCLLHALLGHSRSCFTNFRGGKGVATAAGGFLVLMPIPLGMSAAIWVITFYASRYVSLASILAAVALPVAAFFLGQPPLLLGLAAVIAAFVILRHRANIARLLNGTENRFVKKTGLPQSPPSA
jgi:glycerol-3-phosphate acyltransferase PlsY